MVYRYLCVWVGVWLTSLILPLGAVRAGDKPSEAATISPTVVNFLHSYCIRCHGPDRQNATLRFDTVPTTIGDGAIAQQWQDILDVLNLAQMPPETAKQPAKNELSDVLEQLTADLKEARHRLTDSGGHIVLRRLNRREYRETIDALFGVPIEIDMLPEDGSIDGFDTLGQAHNFSSLHLERYLDLGRRVLDRSFASLERSPKPVKSKNEPEGISRKIAEELPRLTQKIENYTKSIAEGRKQHVERREITQIEVKLSQEYLARSDTKTGCLIPFQGLNPSTHVTFNRQTPHGLYRIRVLCGAASETPAEGLYLKVIRGEYRSQVPDAIDYYEVTGTVTKPQTIEFVVEIDDEIRSNRFAFERRNGRLKRLEQYVDAHNYFFKYPLIASLLEDRQPDLWIDRIEMDGPLSRPVPPLDPRQLLGDRKLSELSDDDVRGIIERFAYEAFRHQNPEPEYVDRLMTIFRVARNHGGAVEDALKESLVVVLASPRFLFLHEPRLDGEKPRRLTDGELAVRLSYFLWSSQPDEELYRVAEEGRLREPEVLAQQVERMIASDRSSLFVETFLTQWLELDRLNLIDPDATASDHYDGAVREHSRREVYAFFRTLLQDDLPITNLIRSDFAVVNSLMARFYDLPGVSGDAFRKVDLPKESVRGGLLGHSAILTLTGTGERTSPVERGAFVLRKILDRPPPPAPANVPMLDEENIGARSIRETLNTHMTKAQCHSCHRRIDPLGFGMENFDPVGQWRTDVLSADRSTTFPIEPAGVMPDGKRAFANFHEMRNHLVQDRDALLSGLTRAMMTYALGRTIGFSDQELIDRIVKETAQEGYGLRTLVHKIVQSEAFLSK